jgi:hypothetical protein
MKIKVGQWVRTKQNNIYVITSIMEYLQDGITYINECDYITKGYNERYNMQTNKDMNISRGWDSTVLRVANTPQELIEVGDLVDDEVMGYLVEVLGVNNDGSLLTNEYNDGQYVYSSKVNKILTPNKNGGYDLQWKKS